MGFRDDGSGKNMARRPKNKAEAASPGETGHAANAGKVSKHRPRQFANLVPETIFDVIEAEAKTVLDEESESNEEMGHTPDNA
ncbi:hypothetical protein WN982_38270 [Paraburkholderia sp. IMGN_8]|uniref:hypothetical protein n=1 Tax=Paraburkholderia sp. IMGN_8 TaxID=3136564 RepID=UPI0031017F9A